MSRRKNWEKRQTQVMVSRGLELEEEIVAVFIVSFFVSFWFKTSPMVKRELKNSKGVKRFMGFFFELRERKEEKKFFSSKKLFRVKKVSKISWPNFQKVSC